MTKTNLVNWRAPAGAIHSLPHIETLSPDPCLLLCLSERTLYILQNLASEEVQYRARYARELTEDGFWPVRPGEDYDALYLETANALKEEVIDMSCNIQEGLDNVAGGLVSIADALGNIRPGGGCGADLANPVAGVVSNLPNETILGPPGWQIGDPESDPPPDGFATWEEYFTYKCQAAHFIWMLERAHMTALKTFEGIALVASIVGPAIAGLSGALPAAFTPAGFILFVGSIIAIGIVAGASWFYLDEMIGWWDDNKDDIICSLYTSGTSVQAVSALADALEDAIQAIVTWGALEPVASTIAELLGTAFGQLAGNGIVEPLFKATASVLSVGEYDCEDCEGAEGYAIETWGYKGGSSGTGQCFRLHEGSAHSHMEGIDDGILSTFIYNREGITCGGWDHRFKICADFGQVYSGGIRNVYIKAKKTTGSLFCISRSARYATSQEQWDECVATGNWQDLPQCGGSVSEFLNISTSLEWRLLFSLPEAHAPINARWLVFFTDVPGPDGWTDNAIWEVDALRIEVV